MESMTPLDRYLTDHKITSEDFAARLRGLGVRATTNWVRRIRKGKSPGVKLARVIEQITGGEVTAVALLGLLPAPSEEAPDGTSAAGGEPATDATTAAG